MVEWRKDGAPLWRSEVRGPSKQDHADGLVVFALFINSKHRSEQTTSTAWWWSALNNLREEVSFFLPSTTKRRSGRSLQLGKEKPKDDGGEG